MEETRGGGERLTRVCFGLPLRSFKIFCEFVLLCVLVCLCVAARTHMETITMPGYWGRPISVQ